MELQEGKQYSPAQIRGRFKVEPAAWVCTGVIMGADMGVLLTPAGEEAPRYLAVIRPERGAPTQARKGIFLILRDFKRLYGEIKVNMLLSSEYLIDRHLEVSDLLRENTPHDVEKTEKQEIQFRRAKAEPPYVKAIESFFIRSLPVNPIWMTPIYFIGRRLETGVEVVEMQALRHALYPDIDVIQKVLYKYADLGQAVKLKEALSSSGYLSFGHIIRTIMEMIDGPDALCKGAIKRKLVMDPMLEGLVKNIGYHLDSAAHSRAKPSKREVDVALWPEDYAHLKFPEPPRRIYRVGDLPSAAEAPVRSNTSIAASYSTDYLVPQDRPTQGEWGIATIPSIQSPSPDEMRRLEDYAMHPPLVQQDPRDSEPRQGEPQRGESPRVDDPTDPDF